jgi:ADP-ribose pyrophosphatase
VSVTRDRSAGAGATGGFVNLQRVDIVASFPDGEISAPFPYDAATREGIDAVVILAWHRVGSERRVFLRSAVRVPLALREGMTAQDYNMWEVPAGIIDAGETPTEAAVRELGEELGFQVEPSRLEALGDWTWPCPGLIAERHYYFMIDLTGEPQGLPTEDGSPLERAASIVDLSIDELLVRCRRGELHDAKTELAIRRFAELP